MATRRKNDEATSDETKTDETQSGTESAETKSNDVQGEAPEVNLDEFKDEQGEAPANATTAAGSEATSEEVGEDDFVGDGTTIEAHGAEVPFAYLTAQELKEGYKARTSDSDDGQAVEWNAQWVGEEREGHDRVALVPLTATPGQTFRLDELPRVDVMEKSGVDPVQFLAGLPVRPDVEGEVRRGTPA